jgi:hypothetical protein
MASKNAKVIIPTAIIFWLLFIVVFEGGAPLVVKGALIAAFVIAIPLIVFSLMAEMGWAPLAKRFPQLTPFEGDSQARPTVHMSRVSVDNPEYRRNVLRLVSTLRVGVSEDALYLSMLFSRVPILGRFFPNLQIPWSAVTQARTYEAGGWVTPRADAGALLRATYDPNYTGTFVELEVGDPAVFIQLPLAVLGDAGARLIQIRG